MIKDDGKWQIAEIVVAIQGILVAAKLMGFIDWSWFWVLTPLWICVTLLAVVVVLIIIGVDKILDMFKKGRQKDET